MDIEDFLIHALAGFGDKTGAHYQQELWDQGDAAQREQVLLARARHAHSRLTGLQAALADKHAEVRLRALKLLLDGPYHPELQDAVAHCLEGDRSKAVREQAFELVAILPPHDRFLPGLAAFLAHKNAKMRERASYHIRRTASQNKDLVAPVVAMLHTPNASTRYLALKALHYPHALRDVFFALCDRLEFTADPASREALGQAFSYYQDKGAVRDELFMAWDDSSVPRPGRPARGHPRPRAHQRNRRGVGLPRRAGGQPLAETRPARGARKR